MIQIAKLPDNDRRELFRNTAAKMGLNDAIIEKDFWVCLTLDYLFHRSPWKRVITFKGGTSLSKAYHLISRFSEDIDLILDWRILGYMVSVSRGHNALIRNKIYSTKKRISVRKSFLPKHFALKFVRTFLMNWESTRRYT